MTVFNQPDTDPSSFIPTIAEPGPTSSGTRGWLVRHHLLVSQLLLLSVILLIGGAITVFFSFFGTEWLWVGAGLTILVFTAALYSTAAPSLRAHWGPRWKRFSHTRLGRVVKAIIAPFIFILTKIKTILLVAAKIKYFGVIASMIISIGAYTLLWGLPFAAGFVVLLFIHEMGHVFAARREGIKASAPMFIPFLGAAIMMKEMPKNALSEARIGIAGPILGSLGCLLPLIAHSVFGGNFWLALAYTGFFLNLFNLIPMLPLDGGRVMSAVSPYMWIPGGIGLLILIPILHNPFPLVILIFGGLEAHHRWVADRHGEREAYHSVRRSHRALVASSYLLLAGGLVLGMVATHVAS